MVSATAAGPMLHWLVPNSGSVAVGRVNVGPTPQMSSPGFAGDRKNVGIEVPQPKSAVGSREERRLVDDGCDDPCDEIPVLGQVEGITGCTLRT